ncbi:hypothetical protein F66182_1913 [Fusarium sp. NRRL 66182]|nr:hypothetical protein F66182_1913 [Fusarium sp. NRRL 66182]
MDPLSIASGCAGLITAIGTLSVAINTFVRTYREARGDLDRVSRELHSLQTVLELIQEDAKDDTKPFPPTIQHHVAGIVSNCSSVVVEIQACITKYGDGRLRSKAGWAINGQGDMEKLRSSLEAHKSALELALDMLALSLTKDIKTDTTELRNDTAAIKDDTAQILQEIAQLQARLPDTAAAPNDYVLQRFLEDMATYTETALDVDANDSDRSSERPLSFDERHQDMAGSPHELEDLPVLRPQEPKELDAIQPLRLQKYEELEIVGPTTQTYLDAPHGYWRRPPNQDGPHGPYGPGPNNPPHPRPPDHTPSQRRANEYYLPVDTSRFDNASTSHQLTAHHPNQNHGFYDQYSSTSSGYEPYMGALSYQPQEQRRQRVIETSNTPNTNPPRTINMKEHSIHSYRGNVVIDLLAPDHILERVHHAEPPERDEFTHARFSFVTCEATELASRGYVFRPSLFAKPRQIKFMLSFRLHSYESVETFISRWNMIHDSVLYASQRLKDTGQDPWKRVIVHIHCMQGFHEGSPPLTQILESMGAKQSVHMLITSLDSVPLPQPLHDETGDILGNEVHCTICEYTVQLRPSLDKASPLGFTTNLASIPIQVILTSNIAYKTIDIHDNLQWRDAIGLVIRPEHVIDVTSMRDIALPEDRFLYEAWTTQRLLVKAPIQSRHSVGLGYVRADGLIKQLRTRSMKESAFKFARKFM